MRALWRGRRRSRRRAAYSPPKPPPAITTSLATAVEASATARAGRRRPSSSAGRIGAGSRRRTRQGAPAKAWLATVAKPSSSSRSASSRCATRSEGGSSRRSVRHAEAVHAAPAGRDQQRAGLAHQPDARAPRARARGPVRAGARARSWPSRSPSSPCATGSARSLRGPLRPGHARAAERVQLGDDPGVGDATKATGAVSGSSQSMPAAAATNGTV